MERLVFVRGEEVGAVFSLDAFFAMFGDSAVIILAVGCAGIVGGDGIRVRIGVIVCCL